ncbi:hypothetical protein DFH06DRAFT_1419005 [Mycena polygramma]|nr:hypothetical protein DFH06DRAFT_1419005 [Mycena polygramma]
MLGLRQLLCGAEDPLGDIYQDAEPIQPHILPIPLETSRPSSRKRKRSNGCGTILHYGAIVSPNNMWRAAEMEYSTVIAPLANKYFPKATLKLLDLGVHPCGCSRRGVGCAVCGNPLGALRTPCDVHQDSNSGKNYYTILPSAVSPPIPPYTPPSPQTLPPPRAVRPLPATPPSYYTRRRHPTSPPPVIMYAEFTPTPSPEIVPTGLPAFALPGWDLVEENDTVVVHGEGSDENREPQSGEVGSGA